MSAVTNYAPRRHRIRTAGSPARRPRAPRSTVVDLGGSGPVAEPSPIDALSSVDLRRCVGGASVVRWRCVTAPAHVGVAERS